MEGIRSKEILIFPVKRPVCISKSNCDTESRMVSGCPPIEENKVSSPLFPPLFEGVKIPVSERMGLFSVRMENSCPIIPPPLSIYAVIKSSAG